ncbi:7-carboxy-7-deazaguanine synthase QueE [Bacteriovorax sp. DB6_IX]|uniref:7-carboxy-7-deazaguanine synthase QueE n=1 Tax=Bacteriovorax sp. DB6_IX TaxID=1353530 RepID=UPI00038A3CE9|nr:7-carboxy-7-deazaguanine synthase QueE [Bacteriovorax sp. DB6_IX]EQC48396.1 4Fe-4S single cluster domain protein [Bacteriovorax sp. DB6_IX]
MEKSYLINAIYRATEGEGVHIGTPQVFVRFQGCAIGCVNCDSKDTWDFTGEFISLEEVWQRILEQSFDGRIKRVSITGGDPLHPKHEKQVLELAGFLKKKGWFVNIEAAGVRVVNSIFDVIDYISFDFKTPSTGVRTRVENIVKLNKQFGNKFQVKAVIADEADFKATYDAYNEVLAQSETMDFPWVLTPCYEPSEEFPMERFELVQSLNESHGAMFRVIGQQHKWVHGPDKKEV